MLDGCDKDRTACRLSDSTLLDFVSVAVKPIADWILFVVCRARNKYKLQHGQTGEQFERRGESKWGECRAARTRISVRSTQGHNRTLRWHTMDFSNVSRLIQNYLFKKSGTVWSNNDILTMLAGEQCYTRSHFGQDAHGTSGKKKVFGEHSKK